MGYVETFNCTCSHQTWGMQRPSIVHVHTRHEVSRHLQLYMFTQDMGDVETFNMFTPDMGDVETFNMFTPDMGYEETFNYTCSHQTWGM
ncbi:hypothetical protein DPMN_022138 [Dreissena polymorpha]|uniref:Uncharacterized protein n=1 Tax=Dreissena polymorpha TaxID=45954 RepID=A0A9D4NQ65_DREPO|nr:hypothetical protein DPMN_022138 [Dreissena polymorpha]